MGNPTIDVYPDDRSFGGGTVVYAGLQAARLGMATEIVGCLAPADAPLIEATVAPARLIAWPAGETTRFRNVTVAGVRHQAVTAWAGRIPPDALAARIPPDALAARIPPDALAARTAPSGLDTPTTGDALTARVADIVHLGPVAREVDLDVWLPALAGAAFVGLTPQGLIRRWGADGTVGASPLAGTGLTDPLLAGRIDVVVCAEYEEYLVGPLLDRVVAAGGLVAVTAGADGGELRSKGGTQRYPALPVDPVDDTGAGDVFAAALFIELYGGASALAAAEFAAVAAALSILGTATEAVAERDRILARQSPEMRAG